MIIWGSILYASAILILAGGFISQITEPFIKHTAKGLSFAMIVLTLISSVLRYPYFFIIGHHDKLSFTETLTKYAPPLISSTVIIVLFLILLGVKIYFSVEIDSKKPDSADKPIQLGILTAGMFT